MTINEQPTGIVGAKSPIIYQAYDALYTNTDFVYEFKVYVWNGGASLPASPVVTINRKPDTFAGGRAYIDTHKIVDQYLSTQFLTQGTYQPIIGDGCVYTAVLVRGVYDGGNTSTEQSNFVLATNGYSYTTEGLNNDITKNIYTDADEFVLTTETSEFFVWYDADYYTSISSGTETVTPTAANNSDNFIQGVDIVQLITNGGTWGTNGDITFTHAGGSDTISIRFECQNRHGQVDAHFLNRYGVMESFSFNALSRTNTQTTSESYSSPIYQTSDLTNAWNYGVQVKQRFNVMTRENLIVNTPYVSEGMVTPFEQFVASDVVITPSSGIYLAATVGDMTYERKKRVNEKLIQYTFQLERSQPRINKLVK